MTSIAFRIYGIIIVLIAFTALFFQLGYHFSNESWTHHQESARKALFCCTIAMLALNRNKDGIKD